VLITNKKASRDTSESAREQWAHTYIFDASIPATAHNTTVQATVYNKEKQGSSQGAFAPPVLFRHEEISGENFFSVLAKN